MPSPASPDTNQFRCAACGRYFNTQGELSGHEVECRAAKQSTEAGRRELEREQREPHAPNDADVKDFEHGTRRS